MNKTIENLIKLGEEALEKEVHKNDTNGLNYLPTVTGSMCDEWKARCLNFFKEQGKGSRGYQEGIKLASTKIMRVKQAEKLLNLLQDLKNK